MKFIILAIFIVVFIYILIRFIQLRKIETKLKFEKEYNKNLSNLNDTLRSFKHDFSNILIAIGGYIYSSDMTGLKKYYSGLKADCDKLTNLSMLNPDVINEPAICAILSQKYYKAEENGISFNLEVFIDLRKINMNIYEFARILRNTYR